MATHSSVLAWRIPGTEEPGGLPSMGSQRVGHDWSDLAAAVAACPCKSNIFYFLNESILLMGVYRFYQTTKGVHLQKKLRTPNKENFKMPKRSFGRVATRGRGNKRNVSSQWCHLEKGKGIWVHPRPKPVIKQNPWAREPGVALSEPLESCHLGAERQVGAVREPGGPRSPGT